MLLAADSEGILAAGFERILQHRRIREGEPMAFSGLRGDLGKADALDGRARAGEILAYEVGA